MSSDLASLPSGYFVLATRTELGRHAPRRVWFGGVPFTLFRDADGHARALVDRCPHRGVALSAGRVVDGTLACAYHGYRFAGDGRCVKLPGLGAGGVIPRALTADALQVVEQDDLIWGQARSWGAERSPPRLPFFADCDYHHAHVSLAAEGTLVDGLENFLDATHTHFVHAGLIRHERARRPVEVHVRREGSVAEAQYRFPPRAGGSGLIGRLLATGIDGRFGRFLAPCIAQLEYRRGTEVAMVISAMVTPHSRGTLDVRAVVTTRRVAFLPDALVRALLRPLFALAIRQDLRVLSHQAAGARAFPEARPVIAPTDVLRPHIEHLLQKGPSEPFAKTLSLWL